MEKTRQVDTMLEKMAGGDSSFVERNATTGFYHVTCPDGRLLKVADLVDDSPYREQVLESLRSVEHREDLDLIIALGMAKEGFDWVWCEHVLTVGYRNSMTEVIQIIGRATRDAEGKTHAQFTNLVAEPVDDRAVVVDAVNNMLKAISCALIMEQVLAPNFNFQTRTPDAAPEVPGPGVPIEIRGLQEPSTDRVRDIVQDQLDELKVHVLNDPHIQTAIIHPDAFTPAEINTVLIPRVIERTYPELTDEEANQVRHALLLDINFKNAVAPDPSAPGTATADEIETRREGENVLIKLAKRFVNLDELSIDLIDSINPFEHAYEILAKHLDERVLRTIHSTVVAGRLPMSDEEAAQLWPSIKAFVFSREREPNLNAQDPREQRLAHGLAIIRAARRAAERMKDRSSPFAAIFAEDDELGLLASKRSAPGSSTEDEITVAQFEAINAFVDENGILPGSTDGGREPGLNEYTLEAYLDAFRNGIAYHSLLAPHDRHGLLTKSGANRMPATLSEIIASNDPLLESAEQIFALHHVAAASSSKLKPDEIAKRRPCEHFEQYAPIFAMLNAELASGLRITKRFEREGSIVPGAAFILNGIIAYVADVSSPQRRGKETDARTRVIFDNGMESNHLLRSFARVLYEDDNGRQIIEAAPSVAGPLFTGADPVGGPLFTGEAQRGSPEDRYTGNIYVVESLSTEPSIAALRGRLFKIGFTTQQVEKRLATVQVDPTFLLAPVRIVTVFETVNLNPKKLEQLIHHFFGHAQLQVDVLLGRKVTPREWFVVPIELVREAINRILDGTILNYRYDHISRKIVPR